MKKIFIPVLALLLALGFKGDVAMPTFNELISRYTAQSQMDSFFTDKMGVISVKAFGAKGDGATDDTAAVQAAIDAANEIGAKAIFFPKGSYRLGVLTDHAALTFYSFDEVVFTGTSYDVGNLSTLSRDVADNTARLAHIAVNVKKFGASESADWQTNRDAFQQANDYVASKGGGKVLIPTGEFTVKGVLQDSHVEFLGNGTLLKHPDGESTEIFKSKVYMTTASTVVDTNQITVNDASKIEVGSLIAIRGAGGMSPLQFTTLESDIDSVQTEGITLTDTSGFATYGFLAIGSEIIQHTGRNGNTLTGVTRGVLGTTASSHSTGDNIGTALRLIGEVLKIEGNTVTIDKPAILSVINSATSIGAVGLSINGISIDGNRLKGGPGLTFHPIRWELVRYGKANIYVENAESAISLNASRDCNLDVIGVDCGKPESTIGAVVWLFQNCHRNIVNAQIFGDMWAGVYLDNRTSLATEWDGTCDNNTGTVIVKAGKFDLSVYTTAFVIVGGNHNRFNVHAENVHTGVHVDNGSQVHTADDSLPTTQGNMIDIRQIGGYRAWVVYPPGNTITGYYEDTRVNPVTNDGNLLLGTPRDGVPAIPLFKDGSWNRPSIAFENEINTGFYRYNDGQVQFVSRGSTVVRFTDVGLVFQDGKDISFGSNTGGKIGRSSTQKMGFWGKEPVVQPKGMPGAANDLESALTLLNYIRLNLHRIGILSIEE